jgi:precorrin-6Y C5,15-methyltransferase (decarboxylating)
MFMEKDITWLSVIGINENGVSGLSEQARALISSATLVVGGARHLELAKYLIKGKSEVWQSPIEKSIEEIISLPTNHRPLTTILASGDPFCYGIGVTLTRYIPIEEMLVIPAPSCFSLAAAKLGWALQDIVTIGLNGRAIEKIIPHLQPKAKILALSTDESTPALLAKLLEKHGFAEAKITVLEHLGGDKERIRGFTIEELQEIPACAGMTIEKLNMMAIEIPAHLVALSIPIVSGLADDLFEHDGQLTKREIRAISLSSLAPRRGELLWDIGLGAGSVAIEWLLCDSANRAIGFEKNPDRAARAARNAASLGVPNLQIIQGNAPEILQNVEAPDAVFIGGGAGNPQTIETAWDALKEAGRLVVNSVTLETEATIIAAHKKYGGNIIRIGIERAEAVGSMTALRPAMSVLQWSVTK